MRAVDRTRPPERRPHDAMPAAIPARGGERHYSAGARPRGAGEPPAVREATMEEIQPRPMTDCVGPRPPCRGIGSLQSGGHFA